jgi:hypothetical protein
VQDPNHGEFQHQYFLQNHPEMLIYIKRKANNRSAETLKKLSAKTTATNNINNNNNNSNNNNNIGSAAANSSATQDGHAGDLSFSRVLSLSLTSNHHPQSSSTHSALNTMTMTNSGAAGANTATAADLNDADALPGFFPDDLIVKTDTVLSELEQQRLMRDEFERKMENKLTRLEEENESLRRLFLESNLRNEVMQERLDRVLKTLYNAFFANNGIALGNGTGTGMGIGKALLSRMPSLLLEQGPAGSSSGLGGSSTDLVVNNNSNLIHAGLHRAIMDISHFEETNNSDSIHQIANNNSLTLRRLSSFDPLHTTTAIAAAGPMPGAELTTSLRGNSFDFAAASVAAPAHKYQSSFDKLLFGRTFSQSQYRTDSPAQFSSDRVTLLNDSEEVSRHNSDVVVGRTRPVEDSTPDKQATITVPTTTTEIMQITENEDNEESQQTLSGRKRKRFNEEIDQTVDTDTATTLAQTETIAYQEPADSASKAQRIETGESRGEDFTENTREFIDLLHRNQSTTLSRLNSLEYTIATLLQTMEEESAEEGNGNRNEEVHEAMNREEEEEEEQVRGETISPE